MTDKRRQPRGPKTTGGDVSDNQPPAPVPSASGFLFAAVFGLAMLFNLYWDATHADYANPTVTIFLGSATLLILGVDVGRIVGRGK